MCCEAVCSALSVGWIGGRVTEGLTVTLFGRLHPEEGASAHPWHLAAPVLVQESK